MTTPNLSKRELGILRGLAAGLPPVEVYRRVAAVEYLSEGHVKKIAIALYRKLGVRTQAGAVCEAIRHGLIPCPCSTDAPQPQRETPRAA